MDPSDELVATLREWIDIFMRRSVRGLLLYARGMGLSMSQIGALFQIYRRGSFDVSDIGGELGVSNAAASQLLERLVQREMIVRAEDPHDRRVRRILLTQKGRRALQEIRSRQSWLDDLACTLTRAERQQVMSALDVLIERAGQLEESRGSSPHR